MRITHISISNYRNIKNKISIVLNLDCSYLIGENNLGKSNFLTLLETIFGSGRFEETDYINENEPISIDITIKMNENELGAFEDHFSPTNNKVLKINYQQKISEPYPVVKNAETNEPIPAHHLKKLNFLKYDTMTNPTQALRFGTPKGIGQLITHIAQKVLEKKLPDDDLSLLQDEKISALLTTINGHLNKIKSFNTYSIKAAMPDSTIEQLVRLFFLSDGKREITSTGSGVQFMSMASVHILCKILEFHKDRRLNLESRTYVKNGKKVLPLILALDEPEVHLSPYLQRSLIRYYRKILQNEDTQFCRLLKDCFEIDQLDGQLIIVTHSPDILVDDHRNIIRFFKNNDDEQIIVVSGPDVKIDQKNEKHLALHFPAIKEAFYARSVILVEGITERGCIREFANKMNISLDEHGICVINAHGEGSIFPLMHSLDAFSIPSFAVYDNDIQETDKRKIIAKFPDRTFFTKESEFETEIVAKLYHTGHRDLIKKIALDIVMPSDSGNYHKNNGSTQQIYMPKKLASIDENNEDDFIKGYVSWYSSKKGLLLGQTVGKLIPVELIPDCYTQAIQKAKELSMLGQ